MGEDKQRKMAAANRPNNKANPAVTNKAANCRPPCLYALEVKVGVLEFLPAAKMELKMPASTPMMMESME